MNPTLPAQLLSAIDRRDLTNWRSVRARADNVMRRSRLSQNRRRWNSKQYFAFPQSRFQCTNNAVNPPSVYRDKLKFINIVAVL
jgi:hypothetical protein